jgi:hypothetical protein
MRMSTQVANGAAGTVAGAPPRRVVASFMSYRDAERAVDRLSDAKFPVERTAIVGSDLRLVEQVTGRLSLGTAALRGALGGAFVGGLIGWLFGAFDWFHPLISWGWLVLDGLWFGAVVGGLAGLLLHALTGGQRDFASIGGLQAARYDLLVDEPVADEAARLLGEGAGVSEGPGPSDGAEPTEGAEARPGATMT